MDYALRTLENKTDINYSWAFLTFFLQFELALSRKRRYSEKKVWDDIYFWKITSEYVLTVARRPLEIATGYLNFQLVARIGYWNKITYFYMWAVMLFYDPKR